MFQLKVKSNIEVLNDLKRSGALKSLISAGLFPSKVIYQMEIYFYIDARLAAGEKKTQAVLDAAVNFNLDERNIYRILKSYSATFIHI